MNRVRGVLGHVCADPGLVLCVSDEVKRALVEGLPVVALESTIISHGMPYPANVKTALEVERVIRKQGAVPATIAILGGEVRVGLTEQEIEQLGKLPSSSVLKCSRRDLAYALATKSHGATTVAATMLIANRAGIRIFVTGGIGGVHRGAEKTMDISADLVELGKTPVAVVCAGVKSILDIPKTLEFLETQGVTVSSYQSPVFPAFYTADSGCKAPSVIESPKQAARMIQANGRLNLHSGIVLAVPTRADKQGTDLIDGAIQSALREADTRGIQGKEITPFLLDRVNQLTKGKSLEQNIRLIKNNAKLGAQVAVQLSLLEQQRQVIVVGAANIDLLVEPQSITQGTSNPGKVTRYFGGVGRNIAESASRSGASVSFITALGNDDDAAAVCRNAQEIGVNLIANPDPISKTSIYVSVLDPQTHDLVLGVSDVEAVQCMNANDILDTMSRLNMKHGDYLALDGNLSQHVIAAVARAGRQKGAYVWFEPVSVSKAPRCIQSLKEGSLTHISMNRDELHSLAEALGLPHTETRDRNAYQAERNVIAYMMKFGLLGCVVTLGSQGCLVCDKKEKMKHVPAVPLDPAAIVNTNGAGDTFVGACIASLSRGSSLVEAAHAGSRAAYQTLQSPFSVSPSIKIS